MRPNVHTLAARHCNLRQRGQALTEFIAIALALVPLFLLMPMIAKYQDIAYATEMAGRYVAFEATLHNDGMSNWKPPAQLAGEVRRRFFSNADAPIKTGDTAGDFKANQNLFWRDPKDNAMIGRFDRDVNVSFGPAGGIAHADAFSAASDNDPFKGTPLPFNVSDKLNLKSPGVYSAAVNVAVADLPADLDGFTQSYRELKNIGLHVSRHTSVLADSWTAKNPAHVEQRINGRTLFAGAHFTQTGVGTAAAAAVGAAATVMESPSYFPRACPQPCGPKLGKLDYWSDTVPADRLR